MRSGLECDGGKPSQGSIEAWALRASPQPPIHISTALSAAARKSSPKAGARDKPLKSPGYRLRENDEIRECDIVHILQMLSRGQGPMLAENTISQQGQTEACFIGC